MRNATTLKPRPLGKFVHVYLDATTYNVLKERAKSQKRTIAKSAALMIEEALGLKE